MATILLGWELGEGLGHAAALKAVADVLVLKDTGLILGDDWHPDPHSQHHGLFRAVHDFMRTHPYQLVAAGPEEQFCLRRTPAYGW